MTGPLAGLVLCGGTSSRLGSDKALLEVGGKPFVLRAAGLLARVADPVMLASGRPGRFAPLGPLPYPEIPDLRPGAGPLAGIVAGLNSSPHPLMAVLAVDMPYASLALFGLLADAWEGEDAVVPITADGIQPLHAVYAKTALPAFERVLSSGRRSVRSALAGLRIRWLDADEWRRADPTGRFAVNVNRAEDLAGLEASGGGPGGWL